MFTFFIILLFFCSCKCYIVNISDDNEIDVRNITKHGFVLIKGFNNAIKTKDDLLTFADVFGKIDKVKSGTPQYMSNSVDEQCTDTTEYYTNIVNDDLTWHADLTFFKHPPVLSIIRGIELPNNTSKIIFKNMTMVLNDYPKRQALVHLYANHSDGFNTSSIHPIVKNGALYVNSVFTKNIIGVNDTAILDELITFIDKHKESETIVEWTIDDVLMWDNRLVQHVDIYDYPKSMRREIQRVVVDTI